MLGSKSRYTSNVQPDQSVQLQEILWKFIHNVLNNPADRQTDTPTNQHTKANTSLRHGDKTRGHAIETITHADISDPCALDLWPWQGMEM